MATQTGKEVAFYEDPAFTRVLVRTTRFAWLLAIIRVRQRWQWIEASLHKIGDPAWVGNGAVLKGFWLRGVAIPQPPGVGDIVEAGPRLHRDERNPDSLTHLLPHTGERLPGRSSVFLAIASGSLTNPQETRRQKAKITTGNCTPVPEDATHMAEIPASTGDRRTGRLLASLIVVMVVLGGVGMTLLARRHWWMLPVASAHGVDVDRLIYTTFVVTGIVFVLVHLLLATFVWRYGAQGTGRAAYWHDDRTLELTYTLVPAAVLVTLISMGAVVWARVHSPAPADATMVEVRAEQFGWLFRYPGPDGIFGRVDPARISPKDNPMGLDPADPASADDIVTRELHLAVNRPVRVRIRSKDVIHSFFIPAFRVKQDAVPGMTVEIWFTPTQEGSYEIACAQLCGIGHYIMRGKVAVESADAVLTWLAQQSH